MELRTEIILWILFTIFLHFLVLLYLIKKPGKSIKGRHVFITGGSSGIGFCTAIECVKLGADVTIVARNVSRLEKSIKKLETFRIIPTQKISFKSIDLTKDPNEIIKIMNESEKENGDIFMLINCCGQAICGTIDEFSIADAKLMMDINYFSTYYPTHYVLTKMKKSRDGIIVITASQAALLGIYGYGCYAASKFALRGLAETLAMETRNFNITVTLALPPDTNTPGFENEEKTKPKETKIISGSGGLIEPEIVAKKLVNDALNGTFFSIVGFESWILSILCCGMSPWNGPILNIVQTLLMGPLRAVGIIIQWNFSRIIRNCAKEKNQ